MKRNTPVAAMSAAREAARGLGVFRARDFVQRGFPRVYLRRLGERGEISQLSRGLYRHRTVELDENQTLVEVARRVPAGTVCLLSALAFHRIGTQAPQEVWLAVPRGHGTPRLADLPVRLHHFAPEAYADGIGVHSFAGGDVRVYSPAKTVVDCFKFRHRVGIDVCLEALSDVLRNRRASLPEIMRHAERCRMSRVMRPYLEAMQA